MIFNFTVKRGMYIFHKEVNDVITLKWHAAPLMYMSSIKPFLLFLFSVICSYEQIRILLQIHTFIRAIILEATNSPTSCINYDRYLFASLHHCDHHLRCHVKAWRQFLLCEKSY